MYTKGKHDRVHAPLFILPLITDSCYNQPPSSGYCLSLHQSLTLPSRCMLCSTIRQYKPKAQIRKMFLQAEGCMIHTEQQIHCLRKCYLCSIIMWQWLLGRASLLRMWKHRLGSLFTSCVSLSRLSFQHRCRRSLENKAAAKETLLHYHLIIRNRS